MLLAQHPAFSLPAAPLHPRDLSGLKYWLDANKLVRYTGLSNGSAVSSWPNLVDRGQTALTQGTAGYRPIYYCTPGASQLINGLAVVAFDNTDDYVVAGDGSSWGNGYAFVAVFKCFALTDDNTVGGWYPTDSSRRHSLRVNASGVLYWSNGTSTMNLATGLVANKPYICGINKVAGNNPSGWFNGKKTVQAAVDFLAAPGGPVLAVGDVSLIAEPLNGVIGEALWFTRGLTDQEMTNLMRYLIDRWHVPA